MLTSFKKAATRASESVVVGCCGPGIGSSTGLTLIAAVAIAEFRGVASGAAKGSTEYRVEMSTPTTVAKPRAPTTVTIAGWVNFQRDGRTVDLSSLTLLSGLTEGGIWRGSKKSSVSPLIHLSRSAGLMMEGISARSSDTRSAIRDRQQRDRAIGKGRGRLPTCFSQTGFRYSSSENRRQLPLLLRTGDFLLI
jgi:hypothetical protein